MSNKITANQDTISDWIDFVKRDYSKLGVRIKTVTHTIKCKHQRVELRVHYPALRASKPTVHDLVELLDVYITGFALPRLEVQNLHQQYGVLAPDEYDILRDTAKEKARKLFIKANKATNRNGEAGELLLYLLTEWILEAPQVIAKMPLKTNPNMPVHGSDGVHIKFHGSSNTLEFIWGESKLHKTATKAMSSAITSLQKALSHSEIDFELGIVNRNIDFTGMNANAKKAMLSYLDPMDENSNNIINTVTCLIGFDFTGYVATAQTDHDKAEAFFSNEITTSLIQFEDTLSKALTKYKLDGEAIQIFFFPVPSVADLRNSFQSKIGWAQ
ncbi:UNVERIFIED_ORG: hypothetical protein J2W74_001991 [Methylorubrum zatmanii]